MDSNIVFLIIAGIAFAINTLLNYNKEKAKNAKRNIQPPKQATIQPKVQKTTPPQYRKTATEANPTTITQKIPINKLEGVSSLDSGTMRQIEKYQSDEDIYKISEDQDALVSLSEDDEIGNEHKKKAKVSAIRLETKDDFKKAIIYSTVLERKY